METCNIHTLWHAQDTYAQGVPYMLTAQATMSCLDGAIQRYAHAVLEISVPLTTVAADRMYPWMW